MLPLVSNHPLLLGFELCFLKQVLVCFAIFVIDYLLVAEQQKLGKVTSVGITAYAPKAMKVGVSLVVLVRRVIR